MRRASPAAAVIVLLAAGCHAGWSDAAGPRTLSPRSGELAAPTGASTPDDAAAALRHPASLAVELVVPEGWHWYERGDDLILTRDGVFLQNVLVERFEVAQTSQSIRGLRPAVAISAKIWPVRTVANLERRFEPAMAPADAADVLLQSRRRDPALVDFESEPLQTCVIAGHPAFRFASSFRIDLRGAFDGQAPRDWYATSLAVRRIPYRSVTCGFMVDRWCYCFTYTAARRHCFEESLATFEQLLSTVELRAARARQADAGS
jgi:hypothetical protein